MNKKGHYFLFVLWIVRAGVIFAFSEPFYFPDTVFEHVPLARNLLHGHGFSISKGIPFLPTTARVPGYGLFLSAFYAPFPEQPWVAVWVQILLEGLAIACLYQTVRMLTKDTRAAWVAACCFILWPYNIQLTGTFLRESILVPLFSFAVFWFLLGSAQRDIWRLVCSGFCFGLGLAIREDVLAYLGIAVLFWIPYTWHHRSLMLRGIAALLFFPILWMGFWTVRNYGQFQRIIPLSNQTSAFLWTSCNVGERSLSNPYALGWLTSADRQRFEQARGQILEAFRTDAHPSQFDEPTRVLEDLRSRYARQYPAQLGVNMVRRAFHYLASSRVDILPFPVHMKAAKAMMSLYHFACYAIGIAGLWRGLRMRAPVAWVLFPVGRVAYLGQLNARYEVQSFPVLFLGVGLAVHFFLSEPLE